MRSSQVNKFWNREWGGRTIDFMTVTKVVSTKKILKRLNKKSIITITKQKA